MREERLPKEEPLLVDSPEDSLDKARTNPRSRKSIKRIHRSLCFRVLSADSHTKTIALVSTPPAFALSLSHSRSL